MDEINAMEFMKAIKRARGQEAKDFLNLAGAVVVPGKGVYTAKPPSKPNTWFRRKTRIVSCGNFQKKSQDEVNYSGGAAAEGVRLMIAEGARRRRCIINGDQCLLEIPSPRWSSLGHRTSCSACARRLVRARRVVDRLGSDDEESRHQLGSEVRAGHCARGPSGGV